MGLHFERLAVFKKKITIHHNYFSFSTTHIALHSPWVLFLATILPILVLHQPIAPGTESLSPISACQQYAQWTILCLFLWQLCRGALDSRMGTGLGHSVWMASEGTCGVAVATGLPNLGAHVKWSGPSLGSFPVHIHHHHHHHHHHHCLTHSSCLVPPGVLQHHSIPTILIGAKTRW